MTDLLSDFRHSVNVGDLASVKACIAKLTPQGASKKIGAVFFHAIQRSPF
jgi:hypothetical protein